MTQRTTVDWGRVAMVPIAVVGGTAAIGRLYEGLAGEGDGGHLVAAVVTSGLTAAFYALIVWAYLRRGPAKSTTTSLGARVAAPTATFLPLALPFVGSGNVSAVALTVGNVLLVVGLAWSVWSIRCLDRNLSVVAQARDVVQSGPYAWVRHPLYLGELVAVLGLSLTLGGPGAVGAWALLVVLQGYRAVHEESLLTEVLPAYQDYARRTARIVPGVF